MCCQFPGPGVAAFEVIVTGVVAVPAATSVAPFCTTSRLAPLHRSAVPGLTVKV